MYQAYFVDDEPLALDMFTKRQAFVECGFGVAGASTDPVEAMVEIRALSPGVVFADLKMPRLTGIEMMERLRSDGCKAEFVIVSVYAELADVRRFFTSHGFDYLLKPAGDHDLVNVLLRLTSKLQSAPPRADRVTPSKELNEILAYLQDYSAMRHTLESISTKWNVNPNTVCNLFAKYLNTTFVAYLTEIRMKNAEDLLLGTDKPVKEIAYICGYSDYFYFCRVFKERRGCAPTRFRESGGQS